MLRSTMLLVAVMVSPLWGACARAPRQAVAHPSAIYDQNGDKLPDSDASSDRVNWVTLSPAVPGFERWNGVGSIDPGCTATLLQAKAGATAPAYLITAGHCYPGGEPGPEAILVDRPIHVRAQLGKYVRMTGNPDAVAVDVDRAVYATMKGTDVAILRVASKTYAELVQLHVHPLALARAPVTFGEALIMAHEPLEGVPIHGLRLSYCAVGATAEELHEADYQWQGPFRNHCSAVGGTSGAPVVSATSGQIVGILTTGTRDSTDGSPDCVDSRPCEIAHDGTRTVLVGENYAQHVYQIAGCFDAHGVFDLSATGCGLERP